MEFGKQEINEVKIPSHMLRHSEKAFENIEWNENLCRWNENVRKWGNDLKQGER
jgi:hypothetical protein